MLPSREDRHALKFVSALGIPQVLIEAYESRLMTPGINHTQVALKPGSFSYCSLYCGWSVCTLCDCTYSLLLEPRCPELD